MVISEKHMDCAQCIELRAPQWEPGSPGKLWTPGVGSCRSADGRIGYPVKKDDELREHGQFRAVNNFRRLKSSGVDQLLDRCSETCAALRGRR
jgi:hypothetical protein